MNLVRRLYDVTHPYNPPCAGCGHKYSKSGTLNFEYSHGEREVNFPIRIQPYEVLTFLGRIPIPIIPIDPATGSPKEGVYEFEVKSVRLLKSGIIACSTCVKEKPRDRLIEDLYTFMKDYWTQDRLPDLEELMSTSSTSLN